MGGRRPAGFETIPVKDGSISRGYLMNSDFNPEKITVPPELEGKMFLTPAEFGKIAGVTRECVYGWARAGYIKLKRFSPRQLMVPQSEVLRYLQGEMMDKPAN
jgi:hypothetical protein